jgi:hypothetical protein
VYLGNHKDAHKRSFETFGAEAGSLWPETHYLTVVGLERAIGAEGYAQFPGPGYRATSIVEKN